MKNSKPTIYDPAFLPNNIYSGVPSWLNLPVLENESELSSMDAVVTGVPWEGGCTIGGYSSLSLIHILTLNRAAWNTPAA